MRRIGQCELIAAVVLAGTSVVTITASAQSNSDAATVALSFATAIMRHDIKTAATYVTEASRDDFLALMDLGDQLTAARNNLQSAVDQKFGRVQARDFAVQPQNDNVSAVDVAQERKISSTLVELDMRLHTNRANAPIPTVTWHAVLDAGQWRIELPACASPADAAMLTRNLKAAVDVHRTITKSIGEGMFARAADVHAALLNAQQPAINQVMPR